MFMPDQTALNKLASGKKICDRRFNEQRRTKTETVFRHFSTTFRFFPRFRTVTVKPWDTERVHSVLSIHEFDGILNEYLKMKSLYKAKETSL